MKHYNIPVFVSHSGCKNGCIFCNQRSITGVSDGVDAQYVKDTADAYLATIGTDADIEFSFFGGSFTGIPVERQTSLLSAAYEYVKSGRIKGIRISTRPDYISAEILCLLEKYGVTAIELGVQSMNDEVLMKNERGHTADDVVYAAQLIKHCGFELGLQMMTGLYGSNRETDIETAQKIAKLKPHTTRIYPTMVLENTKLYELYLQGKYTPPSLEDCVDTCAEIYKIFDENNIKVLRVGLQATDTICENGKIKAGAYHSSFGELVQSRIIRDELENLAKNFTGSTLDVYTDKNAVSKTIGNKRCNILYIKQKYDVDINVIPKT